MEHVSAGLQLLFQRGVHPEQSGEKRDQSLKTYPGKEYTVLW